MKKTKEEIEVRIKQLESRHDRENKNIINKLKRKLKEFI